MVVILFVFCAEKPDYMVSAVYNVRRQRPKVLIWRIRIVLGLARISACQHYLI